MADTLVSERSPVAVSPPQFGAYGSTAGPLVTHAVSKRTFAEPDLAALSQGADEAAALSLSAMIPGHAIHAVRPTATPAVNNKLWFRDLGITTTDPVAEKKIWSPVFDEFERHLRWGETVKGRMAMRSISRFFVGTAFFAAGGIFSRTKLAGYNNYEKPQNALQYAARGVDNTVGKAIESVAYGFTRDRNKAQKAIIFRDTLDQGFFDHSGNAIKGHSIGLEAVRVTFNFMSMSFGDYISRYFLGLFDKNANTGWVKDGRLSFPGGIRELGHALFKGITYAAGEDIFAAIPYIYYTKAQSKLLNKVDPGFQRAFDTSMMGSVVKVNERGQATGGDKLEGVIGFTGAFTVYNILTKIYRDMYANVQERLNDLRHGRKHEHVGEAGNRGLLSTMKRGLLYMAVTVTKISFIAMPSAFLFATLRVPQVRGAGRLYLNEQGEPTDITTRSPHPAGHKKPWFVWTANTLRDAADGLGNTYSRGLRRFSERTGLRHTKTDRFAHEWADAAIAYTPYFMSKSDIMGPFLDTNRTNFVLSGFYTSVWNVAKSCLKFNRQEISLATQETGKWWNEVQLAMLKQPSPHFESEIQRGMENTSYKASLEAYDVYQGSKGYKVLEEGSKEKIDEIHAAREGGIPYTQRYPGRDNKITATSKSGNYTDRIKPRGPVTQKSLIDRVIESTSENTGLTNK